MLVLFIFSAILLGFFVKSLYGCDEVLDDEPMIVIEQEDYPDFHSHY